MSDSEKPAEPEKRAKPQKVIKPEKPSKSCVRVWDPVESLRKESLPFALMVLNSSLQPMDVEFLKHIWPLATVKIAVDGGLKIIDDLNQSLEQHLYVPNIICGDFDSVDARLLDTYSKMNAEVIKTEDENETDFTKALRIVSEKIEYKDIRIASIFVLAPNSGRLDHVFGNINSLFVAKTLVELPRVFIFGNENITWLLRKGTNKIKFHEEYKNCKVGLIPVAQPCIVSTTGLKWNLYSTKLSFGEMISTSNEFLESDVIVLTDHALLWTISSAEFFGIDFTAEVKR